MVVVWSKSAKAELKKAYLYILLDSLQNAELVRDDIINLTIDLRKYPEKYPLDIFKKNNDGTWRSFEKHHYRISYRITPNEIRIVRLRHTSRSPLNF
ncbi:type II toxin-antitoxin system RelE/ParE family toxin [Mucilaginibacter sp.]|jgi:plasmid stabilization system protein ParE|uniref:type II toxin-antitoxin system RelE/ParE family toxin n=1 Tax=Mucilaginibacter sp. TaxID=1882438 RepID=UPI0026362A28|nr:type II toxin-antitoxin system RelE/ParE family toxin [Mucilaginibacter sp.]MDB4918755.1 type toxin-antitoxin system RelE/ParE family toxin [Mucilaginibacter sp.]